MRTVPIPSAVAARTVVVASGRAGFTTRASCLIAAGATALLCGLLLGIVDLARAGVLALAVPLLSLPGRAALAGADREPPHGRAAARGRRRDRRRAPDDLEPLAAADRLADARGPAARPAARQRPLRRSTGCSAARAARCPTGCRGCRGGATAPARCTSGSPIRSTSSTCGARSPRPTRSSSPRSSRRCAASKPPRSLDVGENAGSHSIGVRGADDASTREYRHGRRPAQDPLALVGAHRCVDGAPGGTALAGADDGAARPASATPTSSGRRRRPPPRTSDSTTAWSGRSARRRRSRTYAIAQGREVGLIADPADAGPAADDSRRPRSPSTSRPPGPRPVPASTTFEGLLGPIARESTLVAILGDLDPRSLRLLAGVHPRGTSSTALALLLDTRHVGRGSGHASSRRPSSQVQNAARVLRAAGWQTLVVRCGDGVAASLQTLLTSRVAAAVRR